MRTFEYRVLAVRNNTEPEIERQINALGQDGWEAIYFGTDSVGEITSVVCRRTQESLPDVPETHRAPDAA